MEPSPTKPRPMKTGAYFVLALIAGSGGAFAGSPAPYNATASTVITPVPQPLLRDCFIAAGGLAAAYNRRCKGHKISEAEAAARYLDLSPRAQVAADVAAEAYGYMKLVGATGGRDSAVVHSDSNGKQSAVDQFGHPTRKPIPDDMSVEDFKAANPGMAIDADPNNRTCVNSKSMKTVCKRSSPPLR
jgi:hypothetical protein